MQTPQHYGGEDNPFEPIKIIEYYGLDFKLGNVLKYILRHDRKGAPLDDLRKARHYLDMKIKRMEMKIYLSGSISNDSGYMDKFVTYKRMLKILYPEATVISPVTDVNHSGHDQSWKSYMRADIEAMKTCTHIALIPGWHNSRGAKIEYWLAKRWGFSVIKLSDLGEADWSC